MRQCRQWKLFIDDNKCKRKRTRMMKMIIQIQNHLIKIKSQIPSCHKMQLISNRQNSRKVQEMIIAVIRVLMRTICVSWISMISKIGRQRLARTRNQLVNLQMPKHKQRWQMMITMMMTILSDHQSLISLILLADFSKVLLIIWAFSWRRKKLDKNSINKFKILLQTNLVNNGFNFS